MSHYCGIEYTKKGAQCNVNYRQGERHVLLWGCISEKGKAARCKVDAGRAKPRVSQKTAGLPETTTRT